MPDLITIFLPKAEKASVILEYISIQLVLKKPTAGASNQPSCLSSSVLQLLGRIIKKWTRLNSNITCSASDIWSSMCGQREERGDCWWTAPRSWWWDQLQGVLSLVHIIVCFSCAELQRSLEHFAELVF